MLSNFIKYSIFIVSIVLFASCNQSNSENTNNKAKENKLESRQETAQNFYGKAFDVSDPLNTEYVYEKYKGLKVGDTINLTFQSKVNSVCTKKGCWMRLEMPENNESFVKFKDYGFFVPKDIAETEAIVHGKAFVTETSVEDLKHFAQDAGKAAEEIAAITTPEVTFGFTADGVYLVK